MRAKRDDIHDCVVITYQSFGWDKKISSKQVRGIFLAGAIGIEPTLRESEARVLPLHQAPAMRGL